VVKVIWHNSHRRRTRTVQSYSPGCAMCTPPNTCFLGSPESRSQTASRSVQPFLQGLRSWQTDECSVSARWPPTPRKIKPTDLGCESARKLLLPTVTIAVYCYYYSAGKLILMLLSHGRYIGLLLLSTVNRNCKTLPVYLWAAFSRVSFVPYGVD